MLNQTGAQSVISRIALGTDQAEFRPVGAVARRIAAIDGRRLAVLSEPPNVTLSLYFWEGTKLAKGPSLPAERPGALVYSADLKRLYHLKEDRALTVVEVEGDALKSAGPSRDYPGTPPPSLVVSGDGSRVFAGRVPLSAQGTPAGPQLPSPVLAATRDLAFTEKGVVRLPTPRPVGRLHVDARLIHTSEDGTRVWALDPATNKLHEYAADPGAPGLPPPSGAVIGPTPSKP